MKEVIKYLLISISIFFISCSKNQNDEDSNYNSNNHSKIQSFRGFYFIQESLGTYSLMYYNFIEDSVFTIFAEKSDKVIDVESNPLSNSTFFITANRLNKKTDIPEFEGIKLFRYDTKTDKSELLNKFSPSIEIYSFWMDINRFKLVRVYFDEIVASYVNKHSLIYNPFGKLLSEQNEVFDLVIGGYPVKETVPIKLTSSDRKYQISFNADSVFVTYKNSGKSKKILFNKKVLDLIWAENEKHLIIVYQNSENKNKSILLFDLINNKIVWTFDSKGIKNFLLIGNYLIFDYQENNLQKIEVFNIERLLTVKKLSYGKNNYLKNVTLR